MVNTFDWNGTQKCCALWALPTSRLLDLGQVVPVCVGGCARDGGECFNKDSVRLRLQIWSALLFFHLLCICPAFVSSRRKAARDIFILAFLSQICWSYLWHTQTIPLRSRFKAKTKWVSQAQFVKKNGALNLLQKNPESGSDIHSGGKICLPRFILLWNSSSARCLRNHRSTVYLLVPTRIQLDTTHLLSY